MPEIKWMQCPHCKQTVLYNLAGTCLACQAMYTRDKQPDSWDNLHKCMHCDRVLAEAFGECRKCKEEGKDAIQIEGAETSTICKGPQTGS